MKLRASVLVRLTLGAALLAGVLAVVFCMKDRIAVEEVRIMIDRELSIGSSAVEIELFFDRHGIVNSFDSFHERYQAIIRDVSPYFFVDKDIQIYIYTDLDKNYIRSEIFYSYTFL
jgi:hypothetical protein